jgi:two-component system sensor histidine kinase KdpD
MSGQAAGATRYFQAEALLRRGGGLLCGLAATALSVVIARALEPMVDPAHAVLIFVAPVVLIAIWFGGVASVSTAIACALAINYFFVSPRFTFTIARSQDVWALAVFVLVAVATSAVAAQARAARLESARRAMQAERLRAYANDLAAASDAENIRRATLNVLNRLTQSEAVCIAAADPEGRHPGDLRDAALWAMSSKTVSEAASPWRFWPVMIPGGCDWALGVRGADPDLDSLIEQITAHAGVAFERARQAELAAQAELDIARERLKSKLLEGVSHDLRTPLASMLLSLQSLRHFDSEHDAAAKAELLAVAEDETRRLSDMVEDLLSAARFRQGAAPARIEAFDVRDVTAHLPAHARLRLDAESIAAAPAALGDPALAASAFANVVDNALKYAGDSPVRIRAEHDLESVRLLVEDNGPGLGAEPGALFDAFVRGEESDGRAPGLGLGLSLALDYQRAQGGDLRAENHAGGGARFILSFRRAPAQETTP